MSGEKAQDSTGLSSCILTLYTPSLLKMNEEAQEIGEFPLISSPLPVVGECDIFMPGDSLFLLSPAAPASAVGVVFCGVIYPPELRIPR